MNRSNKFSPEVRERAVRMVQEHQREYPSLWPAVESIAPKIGCAQQTLLTWVQRHEVDTGTRPGVTSAEAQRVKELEREVKELRRANEILNLDLARWLYVAFVVDVFARRIVGWRVSSSMHMDFVLDALEQALYARQPERDQLIGHSDRSGRNTCPFGTASGWLRRASSCRWAGTATSEGRRARRSTDDLRPRPLSRQSDTMAGLAPCRGRRILWPLRFRHDARPRPRSRRPPGR